MIHLRQASLNFPVRHAGAASLKEFFLGGWYRRQVSVPVLRDITLTIRRGERVGIVGANGAGKSTLLRVLAGVYPLTTGHRDVHGRVAALFEPGLGFEMDATGRHNVKLRAYLQGETPGTLARRMAAIEAFADLGPALDWPLRVYSTGMVLRLALAVALGETTDILLIDEFFFAADAEFRQRVEDRLDQAMQHAPLVVLAGHDVNYLASRCTRLLRLEQGRIVADGTVDAIRAGCGEAGLDFGGRTTLSALC